MRLIFIKNSNIFAYACKTRLFIYLFFFLSPTTTTTTTTTATTTFLGLRDCKWAFLILKKIANMAHRGSKFSRFPR